MNAQGLIVYKANSRKDNRLNFKSTVYPTRNDSDNKSNIDNHRF